MAGGEGEDAPPGRLYEGADGGDYADGGTRSFREARGGLGGGDGAFEGSVGVDGGLGELPGRWALRKTL